MMLSVPVAQDLVEIMNIQRKKKRRLKIRNDGRANKKL